MSEFLICENCRFLKKHEELFSLDDRMYCKICMTDILRPRVGDLYHITVYLNEALLRKSKEQIEKYAREEFEIALKEFFDKKYPETVKQEYEERYSVKV